MSEGTAPARKPSCTCTGYSVQTRPPSVTFHGERQDATSARRCTR
ncbi:hypothetical protein OHA72_24875 [Dactylosporangium sp. NBC_01737]|nr:hypothetical protein OHA72_24875 [Dactylosporangium sp. NBC_01737]